MFKINAQNLSFIVLLGSPILFGLLGKSAEAGACVIAGAIGLAFSNLDKIKKFKGAGFEAEMRDQLIDAMISKSSEPETDNRNIGDSTQTNVILNENAKNAYSHAWRSLNNIHADHVITSMPITQ